MTQAPYFVTLSGDPLGPHLLEIFSDPASEGLICAGGFGIRLKQLALTAQIQQKHTIISPVPIARSTQDLDLFLQMELWIQRERGKAVRELLDSLGYEVLPDYRNLQFGKSRDPIDSRFRVKIDLHAREPRAGESVEFDTRRVGKGTRRLIDGERDNGVGIHGRTTPEAFAVDDNPTHIRVEGQRTDGASCTARVLVPHPFASLQMKVKAAHDWLKAHGGVTQRPFSEKHVFDVYLLIAMMLEHEYNECESLQTKYASDSIAQENKRNAAELFAEPDGPASLEVQRQLRGLSYNHATFWEALQGTLGIPE